MYDLLEGTPIRKMEAHFSAVRGCMFHPHKDELYSYAGDQEVLAWTPNIQSTTFPLPIRDTDLVRAQRTLDEDEDNWSD